MASDIGSSVLYILAESLAVVVNFLLKKMGYSEVSVKKLSVVIGWIFVFIFVIFLFWLAITYS
jgi:hypothetical protein